jgi:1-acyl-sn-glycerol-3-phosphate acyltransferase
MEQVIKRHQCIFFFLKGALGGVLKRIFHFEAKAADPGKGPYLVLANHNTDLDPALLALSFPDHMYFVASEHVFRKGFVSWLLRYCFGPISRMKGTTDASAALGVLRTIKRKNNVCLFAEGNRSFNGVTGPIFPATGKLAKATGASLVTYRFEGGYLTMPRWGHSLRKGRMFGYCVNVYTPEQLKKMTPEEVNRHIREDISEDAFARQANAPQPRRFRGKGLAEGLENALYFCPNCGRAGTLHSKGNCFYCDCGLNVSYGETGFFEGENVPFSTVRDWDAWQDGRLAEYIGSLGDDETAFSDENVRLIRVGAGHKSRRVDTGTLSVSKAFLRVGDTGFPLDRIASMGVMGTYKIMFSVDGASYELRAANRGMYCGRKYFSFYQMVHAANDKSE